MPACPSCHANAAFGARACAKCGAALPAANIDDEPTTERLNPDLVAPKPIAAAVSPAARPAPAVAPAPPPPPVSPVPGAAPAVPAPAISAPPPSSLRGETARKPVLENAARNGVPGFVGIRGAWRSLLAWLGANRKRRRIAWLVGSLVGGTIVALVTTFTILHFTSLERRTLRRFSRDAGFVAWVDVEAVRALPIARRLRRAARRIDGSSIVAGAGCTDDFYEGLTVLGYAVSSSAARGSLSDSVLIVGGNRRYEQFIECFAEFDQGYRSLRPAGILRGRSVQAHPASTDASLEGLPAAQVAWLRDGLMVAPSNVMPAAIAAWDRDGQTAYDREALRRAVGALGRSTIAFAAIDTRDAARLLPLARRDLGDDGVRLGLLLDTQPFDQVRAIAVGFSSGWSESSFAIVLACDSSSGASRVLDALEDTLRVARPTLTARLANDSVAVLRRVRERDGERAHAPQLGTAQRGLGALIGLLSQLRPTRDGDLVRMRVSVDRDTLDAIENGLAVIVSDEAARTTAQSRGFSWLGVEGDAARESVLPPTLQDVITALQRELDSVSESTWRITRIDTLEGSASLVDGGDRYRVGVRLSVSLLRPHPTAEASATLRRPWVVDIVGAAGETRTTRALDVVLVRGWRGWRMDRVEARSE